MSPDPGCKIPIGFVSALREAGVSAQHVLAAARLPSRLLDTGVPLGSVVLTFADERRIAVNVIEPSSGADGDEPRAVVTSWNAGG